MILLCGPNGSGKSSLFERYLAKWGLHFVNPDVIAAKLSGDQSGDLAFRAAKIASRERQELIEAKKSFVTEGIRFDPDLIRLGHEHGYRVRCIFVCLESPDMNIGRVLHRVARGGHPIPLGAIAARYARALESAKLAQSLADQLFLVDNSRRERPHRLIARFNQGRLVSLRRTVPGWAQRTFQNEFDEYRARRSARRES